MQKLSIVIITFNEERNIERCLQSVLAVSDEIVVIDSFSTDNTKNICEKYNVRFIETKWLGYAVTKNVGNKQASNDWILSLDADEALSAALQQSISILKQKDLLVTSSFNRITNYCGTWIKHSGWYPDNKLRLFNRNSCEWHGIIHEKIVCIPPIKKNAVLLLKGDCYHYSYYAIEEHYRQAEKFSTLSAESMFANKRKTNVLNPYYSSIVKFIRDYVFNLGFLDGKFGVIICYIQAKTVYMKYNKLRMLYKGKGIK